MGDDKKVKKVGMKDLQRDGWEYELTVSLTIDRDTHMAIASKDRTQVFEGGDPFIINEETGKKLKAWSEKGIAPAPEAPQIDPNEVLLACKNLGELQVAYMSLSKADQKTFVSVKDEMKLTLTPQKEVA